MRTMNHIVPTQLGFITPGAYSARPGLTPLLARGGLRSAEAKCCAARKKKPLVPRVM